MGDEGTPDRERPFTRIDWPADDPTVVWFDLTGTDRSGPELFALLQPDCPGITLAMLEDLISPDVRPTELSFDSGKVKLASTFSVRVENPTDRTERGKPLPAGLLVIQPVELLAGEGWLATCWHPTRTFRGNQRQDGTGAAGGPDGVRPAIAARWPDSDARTAGDLGTLVMCELALTYSSARRAIAGWLEDWELGFYIGDKRFTDRDLANLWGARALLRDWLTPLNIPGVKSNPANGWLPDVHPEIVAELDRRIDRSLAAIERLGDSLRSSFSLLHIQQTERSREANESLQRRIEIAAAAFLVPTLIVGFYGANTWVPGQQEHWGFWVMVAALVTFTALTVSLLVFWQRKRARDSLRNREEQGRIRAEMLRDD